MFRTVAEEEDGEDESEDNDEDRDDAGEAVDEAPGRDSGVGDEIETDVLDDLSNGVEADDLGGETAETATGV